MSKGSLVQRYTASEVVRAGEMVSLDRLMKPSTYVRRANARSAGSVVGVAMNSANVNEPVDVKISEIENVEYTFVEDEPPAPPPAEESLKRIGAALDEIDPVGAASPELGQPHIVIENVGKEPIVFSVGPNQLSPDAAAAVAAMRDSHGVRGSVDLVYDGNCWQAKPAAGEK